MMHPGDFRAIVFLLLFNVLLPSRGYCGGNEDVIPASATTAPWDFAQWCQVGAIELVLESSTLQDVRRALKAGKIECISPPGDADPLWAIRFRSGRNVVTFESDGDMGGPEHRLTGVSIGPVPDFPQLYNLPGLSGTVQFPFGNIGMPLAQLQRRLGPAELHDGAAAYKFEGHAKIHRKDLRGSMEVFDVSGYLQVQVAEGKIRALRVSHVTTS